MNTLPLRIAVYIHVNLLAKKCIPCEGGTEPLSPLEAAKLLKEVKEWVLLGTSIGKELKFKDFKEALAFVNKVGVLAEAEGHHPDIAIHEWNKVRLELSTHAIGGLSENDFILAAKINALL